MVEEGLVRRLLESARYLILVPVLVVLAAAVAGFGAFAWSAILVFQELLVSQGDTTGAVALLALLDRFLVAIALLMAAIGLYELFIGELSVPGFLKVTNLHQLKGRLAGVVILVMAIKFVEKLSEWKNPLDTLWFALGIAVVSAVLIAFTAFDSEHGHA